MVDFGKEKSSLSDSISFMSANICSEAMSFIEADWAKEATELTKSNSVIARATTKNQQTKRSSFFNREDNFACDCSEGNLVMTALFFAVIPTAPSWDLQGKESSSCFFNKEDNFAWERPEESLVMTNFFTLTPKPQTSNSFELPSHFRYYASSIGRFLKPDNTIPNAFNPQSWNLYSYVNNNPVNFNDPLGHGPNVRPYPTYIQRTHSFGMTWFDQFDSGWTPWFGQTEENSWYFGGTRDAFQYWCWSNYSSVAANALARSLGTNLDKLGWSVPIGGFGNVVTTLSMAPLLPELVNLFTNLCKMSNNLNLELGYYISLTKEGSLAVLVIFGTEQSVNLNITAKDIKDLAQAMPSFNWDQITVFGHTHTLTSGYGYSMADISPYSDLMMRFPNARALLVQSNSEGFIYCLEIYGAYNGAVFYFKVLEYCLWP